MRCKDYWVTFGGLSQMKPFWKYKQNNLTDSEILSAQNNDFSFIGIEKREQDSWEAEYKRRMNEKEQERISALEMMNSEDPLRRQIGFGKSAQLSYVLARHLVQPFFHVKELEMTNRPEIAPDHDYLRCWHEQWDSKSNPNILKSRNNYKCRFYYPVVDKDEKSFEGCYREQQDRKIDATTRIGIWTLVTTILGIAVTILISTFS